MMSQLLKLEDFADFDAKDVREVVEQSFSKSRPRFEIRSVGGRLEMRACHKREAKGGRKGFETAQEKRLRTSWKSCQTLGFPSRTRWVDHFRTFGATGQYRLKSPKVEASGANKMRGAAERFDIAEDCEEIERPCQLSNLDAEWRRTRWGLPDAFPQAISGRNAINSMRFPQNPLKFQEKCLAVAGPSLGMTAPCGGASVRAAWRTASWKPRQSPGSC